MIEKKSHFFHNSIIREYDIRGIYGVTLFNKDAEILGNLFGEIVGTDKKINVAFDGRLSSIELKNHLINGLLETGVEIFEIGLSPTPLLYFSCFENKANGGIIVTGSHNPKDHNGFKIVLNNRPFFGKDLINLQEKAKNFNLKKKKRIYSFN